MIRTDRESKANISEIIEDQIKTNNPPETKITYNRLLSLGYSAFDTKKLMGMCLIIEVLGISETKSYFNENRYVKNLKNLPNEPIDGSPIHTEQVN